MKPGRNMLRSLKSAPRSLQRFSEKGDFGLELKAIWFGVSAGLAVWLTAALGGLIWVALDGTGTYTLGVFIYLVGILGVILGGYIAGSRSNIKGWLHGLIVGLLLSFFGLIANLELFPQAYSWLDMGRQVLIWSLWGVFGGYLGFYFKAAHRNKSSRSKKAKTGLRN